MPIFGKKTEASKKSTTKASVKDGASMKDLYKNEATKAPEKKEPVASVVSDVNEIKEVKKEKGVAMKRDYRVLVKPLITEKASHLGTENKYVFAVAKNSNKIDIAKAIEEAYGIKPIKVNIINMEGKVKSRGRITGKRKDWKKAIVALPEGKTIQVYEGI